MAETIINDKTTFHVMLNTSLNVAMWPSSLCKFEPRGGREGDLYYAIGPVCKRAMPCCHGYNLVMPTAYFFIDGAYFKERYQQSMTQIFGIDAEPDLSRLSNWLQMRGGSYVVQRVFYYDCLHDIKKQGESESEFMARFEKQQTRFDKIQTLTGFHVRLGSLSGSAKKVRQKKVDVLLAVEALDHAFRKNMDACFLLAGDLDFAPLVDSLVRLGTWVEVLYDPRSAAKELYTAADRSFPLRLEDYYGFSSDDFRAANQIPYSTAGFRPGQGETHLKRGHTGTGEQVILGRLNADHFLWIQAKTGTQTAVWHNRTDVLENYVKEMICEVTWDST